MYLFAAPRAKEMFFLLVLESNLKPVVELLLLRLLSTRHLSLDLYSLTPLVQIDLIIVTSGGTAAVT